MRREEALERKIRRESEWVRAIMRVRDCDGIAMYHRHKSYLSLVKHRILRCFKKLCMQPFTFAAISVKDFRHFQSF